jgi:hypothetical protein
MSETTSIGRGAAILRAVFDLTVKMAEGYGDNLFHCTGEQADRQFARIAVQALTGKPPEFPAVGSDLLCPYCALQFCPHKDVMHFDKDGCPSCEAQSDVVPATGRETP